MEINIKDLVLKITGGINPIGESNTDRERFENLKVLCELVNELVGEIDNVAYKNKDRYEASMKAAGEYAFKFLDKTLGIRD